MPTQQPIASSSTPRLDSTEIVRLGEPMFDWKDLYHILMRITWRRFLLCVCLSYLFANLLFALVFMADPQGIGSAVPGSFADAFFFSVQTLATIGYGTLHPASLYANQVVVIEALVSLLGFSIVTGLMFARFSRPQARLMFSQVAVIAPRNGVPTLMFRVANQRHNLILEAQTKVVLLKTEMTHEGDIMRNLHDLHLVRNESPMIALTWTVMHPIDGQSPLYGETLETLAAKEAQIIVVMTGTDEVMAQTVRARHVYLAGEVLWNRRFADMLGRTPDGRASVDYTRFNEVQPLA